MERAVQWYHPGLTVRGKQIRRTDRRRCSSFRRRTRSWRGSSPPRIRPRSHCTAIPVIPASCRWITATPGATARFRESDRRSYRRCRRSPLGCWEARLRCTARSPRRSCRCRWAATAGSSRWSSRGNRRPAALLWALTNHKLRKEEERDALHKLLTHCIRTWMQTISVLLHLVHCVQLGLFYQ